MTIRQQGGVFGRNPVFSNVEATEDVTAGGDLAASSGNLLLSGNPIFAQQITIADDAVATITTPRNCGWAFITAMPQLRWSGVFGYDTGSSTNSASVWVTSDFVVTIGAIPTGTTGTDGKVTAFLKSSPGDGKIYLENRAGGALTFNVTFI